MRSCTTLPLTMDQLKAMRVFARVVDEGGFARAARALDLAPPVVTRLVAELETHLGARLLSRTTRRIALTDIGQAYLQRVRSILADVDEAAAMASEAAAEVRGHVRLLAPPAVAVHQIAKHLPRLRQRHPQLTLEVAAPGPVDTLDEAFDITVVSERKGLDGDFVAHRLARFEIVACAAPDYLDRRGRPTHPSELVQHDALLPPLADILAGMTFYNGAWGDDEPGGETVTVRIPGRPVLATTSTDTLYAATLAGLGVSGLPSFVVEDALLEGALERVLPAWRLFRGTLWACLPTRKHVPARTRAVLDFLLEVFGGQDRDPWLAAARCETLVGPAGPRT